MQLISKLLDQWLKVDLVVTEDATKRLYKGSRASYLSGIALAILFALSILITSAPEKSVYIWLALIISSYILRYVISIDYEDKHQEFPSIFWLKRYRIGVAITGVLWASSMFIFFQPEDQLNQSIILFTLTGICAAAALSYAIDYLVLSGFVLPITLAIFFRLAFEGSYFSIIMSYMVILFIIFFLITARKTNQAYVKNLMLANTAILGEERERAYSKMMEMIANNTSLNIVLETILLNLEKQYPQMLTSILLLDNDGKHLNHIASPSLPAFYSEAIDGLEIGAKIGSCGAATFIGSRVIAQDILNHPNWIDYKALAIQADLRACWSEPIKNSTGKILGSFTIYHREPTTPSEKDVQLITQNAGIAGIAIELARSSTEQRLATLFYQHTNESLTVTDHNKVIIAVNPAFTMSRGYTAEEAIGQSIDILTSNRRDDTFYRAMYQSLDTTGKWEGELWVNHKDGSSHFEWLRINTIFDDNGNTLNFVILATDITKRKESEDLIWKQANFDGLTDLPNRIRFQDRFKQEIKKTKRTNLPLALLFIDLDGFKEVNDSLGHQVGDILLKEAAERLISCVRESDTVAHFESIARIGGDEFTIILSELKDISCVKRIAQAILNKIAMPYQLGEDVAYISASIGITLYPDDSDDINTLITNADQAMYAAKLAGKNRFCYFAKSMKVNIQKRMNLTKDLHGALEKQQFHLVYQPIVNLRTNKIQKAEALIRWQHPTKGLVNPADFIPIAERTGLINEIGNWVFIEALTQVAAWRQTIDPNFQISVNKSPIQIYNVADKSRDNFLNWATYMREHNLPGDCIAVEITEGLLLDSNVDILNHLLEFRDAGIQVALDDFGTGYSSLSYLKKFDIDYIKIDQSFVQNIEIDSDNMVLCEAIIVMAHKLKLKVIAEGIETQEQLDLLKFAGCDFGQGYFFSKPILPEEFEKFTT
jgi:diguanylate cyclase (GGDEF)-like protein/PAS domain S-box-containing protein